MKRLRSMKTITGRCLLFAFLLALPFASLAQISKPGIPPGMARSLSVEGLAFVQMPPVDARSLLAEDAILDEIADIPWRFGENITVNLNPGNSGEWTDVPGGDRLWRLGIHSPGAYSLNLTFDEYLLPPGAELYILDPAAEHVLGAFTDLNNQEDGYFATTLLPGDSLIIEYLEPEGVAFAGRLGLETVTHAYRDPAGFSKSFGQSGWCNINVACDEARGWEDQVRSVVMLVTGGNGFCSGVMVNNTAEDARPFLLSANHCYRNPSTVVAWFNWQSETCENPMLSPGHDAMSGAVLRARNSTSDFWLLELNHRVPQSYAPYFAGWNRSMEEELLETIVGIHHPRGDIKKFSYSESGVQASRYLGFAGSGNSHWRITWDGETTTEPGSSGSPIFDSNGLLLGQLHGGYAACGNTEPDWYGRFGMSWIGGGEESDRLSDWLDPLGVNPATIGGYDPHRNRGLEVRVSPEGAGLTTPETGFHWYHPGSVVGLYAVPLPGWAISHWDVDGHKVIGKYAEATMGEGHLLAIAHFDLVTSSQIPVNEGGLNVFPVPAKDHITVQWAETHGEVAIRLLNVSGQEVVRIELDAGLGERVLMVGHLPAGVYLLKVSGSHYSEIKKLILH